MFKKVLIAEDHELANISIQNALRDLGVENARYVYYCDHALNWLQKAIADNSPFDLLITDLGFEDDYTVQVIKDGLSLIKAAKSIQFDLKIIILSAERRTPAVDELLKSGDVSCYVRKARRDARYLMEALQAASENRTYISPEPQRTVISGNIYEFSKLDLAIITLLAEGVHQKNIPTIVRQRDIKPFSLSSIEKSLKQMREFFGFAKNEQLIAYCKDVGII